MTDYPVSGEAFTGDSVSVKRTPPSYVESVDDSEAFALDFSITPDFGNDQFDVTGGYARIYDGSEAWNTFFDGTETIALEDVSGITYLYVVYDEPTDDLRYEALPSESPSTSTSILIAEVDGSDDSVTSLNRDPEPTLASTGYKDTSGTLKRTIQYDEQLESLVVIKE